MYAAWFISSILGMDFLKTNLNGHLASKNNNNDNKERKSKSFEEDWFHNLKEEKRRVKGNLRANVK